MRLSRLCFRVIFILVSISFLFLNANARFNKSVQSHVEAFRGSVLERFVGEGKSSPGFCVPLEPGPLNETVEALSISTVPRIEPALRASTITIQQF
jgi:hypothetical protein